MASRAEKVLLEVIDRQAKEVIELCDQLECIYSSQRAAMDRIDHLEIELCEQAKEKAAEIIRLKDEVCSARAWAEENDRLKAALVSAKERWDTAMKDVDAGLKAVERAECRLKNGISAG